MLHLISYSQNSYTFFNVLTPVVSSFLNKYESWGRHEKKSPFHVRFTHFGCWKAIHYSATVKQHFFVCRVIFKNHVFSFFHQLNHPSAATKSLFPICILTSIPIWLFDASMDYPMLASFP